MYFLYLDDSGKVHPNDPTRFVVYGGFAVHEERYHPLIRQITGAKSRYYPGRSNPNTWEIKSLDLLNPRAWRRAANRDFTLEIARILRANRCHVYAASMEKAKATGSLDESRLVPLAFHRLLAKFYDEIDSNNDTGLLYCDWSTHQMDQHIATCVASLVASRQLDRLRGGVSYASSHATPCVQVADLMAGTIRRQLEGETRLDPLAQEFSLLRYTNTQRLDFLGYTIDSIFRVF